MPGSRRQFHDIAHDRVEAEILRGVDARDADLAENVFVIGGDDAADDDEAQREPSGDTDPAAPPPGTLGQAARALALPPDCERHWQDRHDQSALLRPRRAAGRRKQCDQAPRTAPLATRPDRLEVEQDRQRHGEAQRRVVGDEDGRVDVSRQQREDRQRTQARRQPPDLDALAAELEQGDYKAVGICHNETSTGMTNPAEEIGKLARKNDVIYILDGITSVGGLEVNPVELLAQHFVHGSVQRLNRGTVDEGDGAFEIEH